MGLFNRNKAIAYKIPFIGDGGLGTLSVEEIDNGWAIFDYKNNDWLRDNYGHIDTRLTRKRAERLLMLVKSQAMIDSV